MKSFLRLWGAPLLLAVLSLAGLLIGLLGDGVWDWLSAALLAVPVVVGAWFGLRRRHS
jgi:hypothetical protein